MGLIQELDFIGIPLRDADRARTFYGDLGMRPDEHAARAERESRGAAS